MARPAAFLLAALGVPLVFLCLILLPLASAKVLGGHHANLHYYSHQVAIIVRKGADEVSCGGSILSNIHVLTAAHCIAMAGFGPGESAVPIDSQITVRYGHVDWLLGSTAAVDRVWVHQEYNSSGILRKHDVAVLRVSRENPIVFSSSARPVKLAPVDSKLVLGADVTIAGWGLGSKAASGVATPARSLKATTVNMIPQMCALPVVWGSGEFEEKLMLCAGCDTAQADACDGDDGGALTTTSASGGCAIVVGVASTAVCGEKTLKPSVYTRMAPYVAWIESIVGHPVRSTHDLAPRTDCDKCVNPSNPPPCGNAPSTVDRDRCHLEGELAMSFKLSFGESRCVDGYTHLKAELSDSNPKIPGDLKKGVVYLLSAANTGTEVVYIHGKTINTPLSAPITRVAQTTYSHKKKGWVFKIKGCSTTGTTYAALYRSRGPYGYFQISLPIN